MTPEQLHTIERLIGELEYLRRIGDVRDSLRNEPTLTADARRMFDLPLGALLPDGTKVDQWNERLRTEGATPIYSDAAMELL